MGNYFSFRNISLGSWGLIAYATIVYGLSLTASITQLMTFAETTENKKKTFKELTDTAIFYTAFIGLIGSLIGILLTWTYLVWTWAKSSVFCINPLNMSRFGGTFSVCLFLFFLFTFGSCFITWYYCMIEEDTTVETVLDKFKANDFAYSMIGLSSIFLLFILISAAYNPYAAYYTYPYDQYDYSSSDYGDYGGSYGGYGGYDPYGYSGYSDPYGYNSYYPTKSPTPPVPTPPVPAPSVPTQAKSLQQEIIEAAQSRQAKQTPVAPSPNAPVAPPAPPVIPKAPKAPKAPAVKR